MVWIRTKGVSQIKGIGYDLGDLIIKTFTCVSNGRIASAIPLLDTGLNGSSSKYCLYRAWNIKGLFVPSLEY